MAAANSSRSAVVGAQAFEPERRNRGRGEMSCLNGIGHFTFRRA